MTLTFEDIVGAATDIDLSDLDMLDSPYVHMICRFCYPPEKYPLPMKSAGPNAWPKTIIGACGAKFDRDISPHGPDAERCPKCMELHDHGVCATCGHAPSCRGHH